MVNGAKNKKPAEYCEVSLYLDNSDGAIAGEDKEVKITRRITRSGISVYRLNGKTYTRGKVMELLAGARLSSDGFNIILQGDVTKIIEMSPKERKGIIDEISGIAEFDEKKEKAAKELERVDERIRENLIVISQRQQLVSRLKAEKENAEKYRAYSEELLKSKASYAKKRVENAQTKITALDKEISGGTASFNDADAHFARAEREQDDAEAAIRALNDEIIKKSSSYETARRVDQTQGELLRKRDRIDSNEREIVNFEAMTSYEIASVSVKEVLKSGIAGMVGTLASLISISGKYGTALEVAMGRHADDVVVETDDTAVQCIKYLKERKLGRARFLPLNRLHPRPVRECKEAEHMMELIKFEKKYFNVVAYVLGETVVSRNIDEAKKLRDFRVVTLDGDLVETSGAMTGGFYAKKQKADYSDKIRKLEEESEALEEEIRSMGEELKKLQGEMVSESDEVKSLRDRKASLEKKLDEMKSTRGSVFNQRSIAQARLGNLKIEKARLEATLDQMKLDMQELRHVKEFYDVAEEELQEKIRRAMIEINKLGPVNMKAIEDYNVVAVEFDEIKAKLDKLTDEKASILHVVEEVEKRRHGKFMEMFAEVAKNYSRIYHDLTGGFGQLRLEEENNIDSGLLIEASPENKKVVNLDAMSGGEKTLTSLSFLFGIMEHYGSPFYVLDEVDASLDKANTKKIVELVKKYSKEKQFIVISHNDFTVQEADKVFGVSMEEGVSKVFSVKMPVVA